MSTQAAAQDSLEDLRAADLQIAQIGETLSVKNAAMCDPSGWRSGLVLHDIRQYDYPDSAKATFGFERDISVEAVVPGSPADLAGVKPNMGIEAIDGVIADKVKPSKDSDQPASNARMDAVLDLIDQKSAAGALVLDTVLNGEHKQITVHPVAGCTARFQISLKAAAAEAYNGGKYITISRELLNYADTLDELALIMAHELSHRILHHTDRLKQRGKSNVEMMILGPLSKTSGRVRFTEVEADRLALYVMANAGYDPSIAPDFWDRFQAKFGMGVFGDGSHPGREKRVEYAKDELISLDKLRAVTPAGQIMIPDFAKPPFAKIP